MWFTETAWPPVMICLVGVVLLLAAWTKRQRFVYLAGIVGLACVVGGLFFVEAHIVTDAERVEADIIDWTAEFQREDIDGTLSYISPQAAAIRTLALAAMEIVDVHDDLRITDLSVTLTNEGTRAVSRFRANATVDVKGYGNQGRRPSYWEVTWQKQADQWKVIRVVRLNVVTGEQIGILQ